MSLKAKLLAGCGGSPMDPNFKNVALLLPGNGSNGAQNNTFLDSSTNNFTITRNGNTTQGSFSPYGSYWSGYFDGSGDFLTTPNNSALAFGTGSFTVEAWVYLTNPSAFNTISATRPMDSNYTNAYSFGINSSGAVYFYTNAYIAISSSSAVASNTWNHVAVVRNGTALTIYVNGSSVATATNSQDLTTATTTIGALASSGEAFGGYISNVRVVKGTAVYTTAFTPPTAPLTAISGTSLLTCQSNRFIDNSSNAFTITKNGDTKVTRFSPFSPASAYSTTANGGSAYFDGSGDWLSAPSNTAFAFGTGDFTIEAWVFRPATGDATIISPLGGPSPIFYNVSQLRILDTSTGNPLLTDPDTFPLNQWVHVACTRASGTMRLFVNGALKASGTVTNNFTSIGPCYVGSWDGTNFNWTGSISNARVVKGTAVYTAAFTPPTAPVTAISGTSLLVNATNAAIFDNAMINDLETVGNAQVSTAQSKFGGSSMYFDGSGDYLVRYNAEILRMGGGNITVECWIYPTTKTGWHSIFWKGTNNNTAEYGLGWEDSVLIARLADNGSFTVTDTVNLNAWNHIAYVRNGTNFTVYINGTAQGTTTSSTSFISNLFSEPFQIGYVNFVGNLSYFQGYIDDFRITKGVARYTSNFTPPTSAFANQ